MLPALKLSDCGLVSDVGVIGPTPIIPPPITPHSNSNHSDLFDCGLIYSGVYDKIDGDADVIGQIPTPTTPHSDQQTRPDQTRPDETI